MAPPEIRIHSFDNGLTLVGEVRPDVRAAAFHLLLPVGSVSDPDGKEGLAKVLGELCYRGAGSRDSRSLSDALDALGLQRSGGVGAEAVSFGGALLADNLREALEICADIVRRPQLPEDELPPVVSLAIQELQALDDQPAQKMFDTLRRDYFTNEHGRSPLGTEASLGSLSIADLQQAHPQQYLPEGGILSVAGRFRWEELVEDAARTFGDWVGSPPKTSRSAYRVEPHYHHIEQDTAQEHIGVAYGSVPPGHPERYSARMAVAVLSGGMSARLFTEVREKRGLVYSVHATAASVRDHGYVLAYAGTTPEKSQETLDVLLYELKRVREGVTDAEVERACTGSLSSLVMQGESTAARAGAIASDMFHLGRVRSLEEIRRGVESVTPHRIVEHLAHCPAHNFTVTTLGPRQLTPNVDAVAAP